MSLRLAMQFIIGHGLLCSFTLAGSHLLKSVKFTDVVVVDEIVEEIVGIDCGKLEPIFRRVVKNRGLNVVDLICDLIEVFKF